jgi:hypothetical protein
MAVRFAAKAVQHAVSDARLQRGELFESTADAGLVISGQCWLSAHFGERTNRPTCSSTSHSPFAAQA